MKKILVSWFAVLGVISALIMVLIYYTYTSLNDSFIYIGASGLL